MSADEQFSEAITRALTAVRAQIDQDLAAMEQELVAAGERVRTDIQSREAERVAVGRILDAMRALDQATSLSEALDVIAQSAGREVERAAVLLVGTDSLRCWRATGFADRAADARALVVAGAASGIAGSVRRGQVAGPAVFSEQDLPIFARGSGPRHALALPITVAGRVVAVLYADAHSVTEADQGRWPAMLEVLTRHTSRVLEALTVRHATHATLAG